MNRATAMSLANTYEVAAALPQFANITNFILSTVAALFTAVLVIKVFKHWAKGDWGALTVEVIAAIVCAWIVITPDTAVEAFKAVAPS